MSTIIECRKMDERFTAALNARDLDSAMACYWKSAELVVYPPSAMVLHGWDEVRAYWAGFMKAVPYTVARFPELHYTAAGDFVFGWGTWELELPGGAKSGGRYTALYAKRDGHWVYIIDHASAPTG